MKAMQILSAAEMQTCDRATSERFGVPSLALMRAAANAVAAFARAEFPGARRVTVLCGRGNNGGDGMMAARLLSGAGLDVAAILLGAPEALTGDAAVAWKELAENPIRMRVDVAQTAVELERCSGALGADLIIDAILGTGFKPPMKGMALDALAWLGSSRTPVLAVDLPSGWPADATGATVDGPVFPADAVITFTAPKPAHVFGQLTRGWRDPVVVAPIGSPDAAIVSTLELEWTGSSLPLVQTGRAAAANKGSFGHVLVVGGSFGAAGGKAGAPAMAALAALRAGAGLVTAAVPEPALTAVSSVAPELMTWPLKANCEGCITAEDLTRDSLEALTAGKTVLAIGPGMGEAPETAEFLKILIETTTMPLVMDADALNLLAVHRELLARVSEMAKAGRTVVLTPHPGEMARLAGVSIAEVQADRLETARSFAAQTGVTLVLKGARTLVAHAGGRVAVNTTGNPAMAKGGSGDTLTGLIAGLIAQYPADAGRAVEAAVYLHGLAGDMAVRASDEHTLLATDCFRWLPRAFRFRPYRGTGYFWIKGLPAKGPRPESLREGRR
jgi:NAD(P)H-hydrate epimerase